jgi:LPXTG-motif cell wall-anchored protein
MASGEVPVAPDPAIVQAAVERAMSAPSPADSPRVQAAKAAGKLPDTGGVNLASLLAVTSALLVTSGLVVRRFMRKS